MGTLQNTSVHLLYLAEFFVEWELFWTNVVEKIKTYVMFNNFFPKIGAVHEILWGKYGRARQATGDNMVHCMQDK
jgi:hypothetical protein